MFSAHRILFITLAFSFASIAGFGFGLWWLYVQIGRFDAVFGGLEKNIAGFEREREEAKRFAGLKDRARRDFDRIEKFFVNREEPLRFIEDLEALASQSRNTIAIDADEAGSSGEELLFRLTLEGREENLAQFVRLLERVPYHLVLEEMAFQSTRSIVTGLGGSASFSAGPERSGDRLTISVRIKTL